MTCPDCLALEFASDESLRRLVHYQAVQLDRLTGGTYTEPDFDAWEDEDDEPAPEHAPDAAFVLEALMGHDDIYRKPPRAAAPRLLERLAEAGFALTYQETA